MAEANNNDVDDIRRTTAFSYSKQYNNEGSILPCHLPSMSNLGHLPLRAVLAVLFTRSKLVYVIFSLPRKNY